MAHPTRREAVKSESMLFVVVGAETAGVGFVGLAFYSVSRKMIDAGNAGLMIL